LGGKQVFSISKKTKRKITAVKRKKTLPIGGGGKNFTATAEGKRKKKGRHLLRKKKGDADPLSFKGGRQRTVGESQGLVLERIPADTKNWA